VLVHGVTLTARLNWEAAFPVLGQFFRVPAFDQRGHGSSAPRGAEFRLEDSADDVVALADALGIPEVIPVGYSMGGLVAQLVWRRHRERVAGLVLVATARSVHSTPMERMAALGLPTMVATVALTPALQMFSAHLLGASLLGYVRDRDKRSWARSEMSRTSLLTAIAAIQAVTDFNSREWIGSIDVPTAVVITTNDHVVSPARQRRLAAAIPHAGVFELDGDHGVFLDAAELFAEVLLDACQSVAGIGGELAGLA
jgi:3-oxoadipate enol-lactonase